MQRSVPIQTLGAGYQPGASGTRYADSPIGPTSVQRGKCAGAGSTNSDPATHPAHPAGMRTRARQPPHTLTSPPPDPPARHSTSHSTPTGPSRPTQSHMHSARGPALAVVPPRVRASLHSHMRLCIRHHHRHNHCSHSPARFLSWTISCRSRVSSNCALRERERAAPSSVSDMRAPTEPTMSPT